MRHHTDRADVVAFDFRAILLRHPLRLKTLQALEWAWIPAVDLYMHGLVLTLPFLQADRRALRARVLTVLLVRVGLFALLALVSLKALLLYALAYLLFLHLPRFMDVHQHTYELTESLAAVRAPLPDGRDRAYEERNTFSNPVSLRHPWLNLLWLNFGYHNAHHVHPTTPWYALPALHRELYGDSCAQALPFAALVRAYARHRVARVLNADPPDMRVDVPQDFVGVVGVSFLTAH
jgi:fatty acid desaturase